MIVANRTFVNHNPLRHVYHLSTNMVSAMNYRYPNFRLGFGHLQALMDKCLPLQVVKPDLLGILHVLSLGPSSVRRHAKRSIGVPPLDWQNQYVLLLVY